MKTEFNPLIIPEFKNKFANRRSVVKSDLKTFYQERAPEITEQGFRRFLYALEKEQVIFPVARGLYVFQDKSEREKKKFIPSLSSDILSINTMVKDAFPYIQYSLWETRILHDFMIHQPGQNQIFLEVEKDASESVFNALNEFYPHQVFLRPDTITFERYISHTTQCIIILHMISQSPVMNINSIPYPSIEKILVDILVDNKNYYMFQGQELVDIYKNVFDRFLVNEKTLFRYAQRRKPLKMLKDFINHETHIKLIHDEVKPK